MKTKFIVLALCFAALFLGCTPRSSASDDALDIASQAVEAPKLSVKPLQDSDALDIAVEASQQATPEPRPQKVLLSDFNTPNTKKIIRVKINLRTTRNGRVAGEDLEDRIWNMLVAHTPEPYELTRSQSVDRGDATWGTLTVNFKRVSQRLRRVSKTAPWRTKTAFELAMDFKLPADFVSSWSDFNFKYEDEFYADEDLKINAAFWQALENRLPTLTASAPGEAANWARSLGLITTRLSNDAPERTNLPGHRYFHDGCVLYENQGQTYVQQLSPSFSAPRPLSMAGILALHCSRDATFVFAVNSQNDVDLYFQPSISSTAWKTGIHFDSPVSVENFAFHIDDDIICAWNGAKATATRKFEIRCLDRMTGLPRWQTKSLNGMVRGFAATPDSLVFVSDQHLFSIGRNGRPLYVQKLEPSTARIQEPRYCQTQNVLVYATHPGHIHFVDLRNGEFVWSLNTFASEKLFCGLDDIVVFSEAGGYLLGVNARTLSPLWKFRPVTMPHDILTFAGSLILLMDRSIIALDLASGRVLAEFKIPVLADSLIRIGNRMFLNTSSAIHLMRI